MKKGSFILLILFILSGFAYYIYFAPEISGNVINEKREVFVIRAVDGDTLEIENNEKVRMLGVNTPEKGEFGAEADLEFTKQLENKTVFLESSEKDQYGRSLGYIFYKDRLFNEELLKNGFAHIYYYEEDHYTSRLKKAEEHARQNEIGIWKKSTKFGCLILKELKYFEDGERCTNKEKVILENTCETLSVYFKDDTSKGFHYDIQKGIFSKNYSCKFNDEGDSLYIWDDEGLVLFERYGQS